MTWNYRACGEQVRGERDGDVDQREWHDSGRATARRLGTASKRPHE